MVNMDVHVISSVPLTVKLPGVVKMMVHVHVKMVILVWDVTRYVPLKQIVPENARMESVVLPVVMSVQAVTRKLENAHDVILVIMDISVNRSVVTVNLGTVIRAMETVDKDARMDTQVHVVNQVIHYIIQ